MNIILLSPDFRAWFLALRDSISRAKVGARLLSAAAGNFRDAKPVGGGAYEMRINVGPGYRACYTPTEEAVYLLLVGGDKATRSRDVKAAIEMAANLERSE